MKRIRRFIVIFVLLLGALPWLPGVMVLAQGPFYDPKPKPPVFEYVTMDPHSGAVTLYWTAPAPDVNNPNPTGYIIYKRVRNAAGEENNEILTEVGPGEVSFVDYSAQAHVAPVIYTIASKGPAEPSPMTGYHITMHAKVGYDTCADMVHLSWTPYVGWGNRVAKYRIYAGERPAWSDMVPLDSVSGTVTKYSYKVPPNKTFYYYIEACRADSEQRSRSNALSVRTRDLRIAAKLWVDSIISRPTSNRITLSIDSTSRVSHYRVARQNSRDEFLGKIDRLVISEFTSARRHDVVDSVDGAQTHGRKRFYYVAAVDQCGAEVDRSNLPNSIIVRVGNHGSVNTVTWDTLDVGAGHKVEYRLFRRAHRGAAVEEAEIATLSDGMPLEYKDDVSSFAGKGYEDRFCYYVKAWEINAEGRRIRNSESTPCCSSAEPSVMLPTAISPLERTSTKNLPRNVFAPLSSYWSSYTLYVYNRSGNLVYSGQDKGWDGTLRDGSYAPEGAYLYRIELMSEDHVPKVFTGSFMVLYPVKK